MCFCCDWMLTLWESHLFCDWKEFTWELVRRARHRSALCHYEWQHRNIYVFQKLRSWLTLKLTFKLMQHSRRGFIVSEMMVLRSWCPCSAHLTGSSLWIESVSGFIALSMILEFIFWIRYVWKEFNSGTLRSLCNVNHCIKGGYKCQNFLKS